LLPGRRILLNGIDDIALLFDKNGYSSLADIQKLLKNKSAYEELAKKYTTTDDYLAVLNREINSYVNKPVKLDEIPVLPKKSLTKLNQFGFKTTKDIYDACVINKEQSTIVEQTGLSIKEINELLCISDLLRINGVGPAYAMVLYNIGIKSVKDYFITDSKEILDKLQKENSNNKYTKANLGIKDVEYCKRFCKYLDQEI
jgi:hypothetical protein